MRAKQLRVVFETGELAGVGGVTVTAELTLYEDGSVTGAGVLLAGDSELAVAATGTHSEALSSSRRAAG